MFSKKNSNRSKWPMKYCLIKRKDRNMMDTEADHTMKINITRLTLLTVTLKETATKVGTLRRTSINNSSQGMNGTFLLPVNLCFGGLSLFCQKTSMNNGILIN